MPLFTKFALVLATAATGLLLLHNSHFALVAHAQPVYSPLLQSPPSLLPGTAQQQGTTIGGGTGASNVFSSVAGSVASITPQQKLENAPDMTTGNTPVSEAFNTVAAQVAEAVQKIEQYKVKPPDHRSCVGPDFICERKAACLVAAGLTCVVYPKCEELAAECINEVPCPCPDDPDTFSVHPGGIVLVRREFEPSLGVSQEQLQQAPTTSAAANDEGGMRASTSNVRCCLNLSSLYSRPRLALIPHKLPTQ